MSRTLRVATFNLESLDDRPSAAVPFEDRIKVLRPELERLRADVLCLQEINARETSKKGPRHLSALDRLITGTAYETFHRVVSLNRGGARPSDRHNLVILSRLPVLSHGQVWHDLVRPPIYSPTTASPEQPMSVEWDRPILHAALQIDGQHRLHIVNLHLRAPRAAWLPGQKERHRWTNVGGWAEGFFLAEIKRAGQALEARLLVERLMDEEPDAMICVCGDFNADDGEMPMRTIRGDEEDTGNGALAPRMLVGLDRTISESQRFSVIHRGRRVMLDHILVSRPLLAWYRTSHVNNEALGDELVSPALAQGAPESFHAAVVAEFSPPPRH